MICPICKQTQTIIQNNNYFCPSCGVYIGKVGSDVTLSPFMRSSLPNTFNQQIEQISKVSRFDYLKSLAWRSLILVIPLLIFFVLTNLGTYFDLPNHCLINIETSEVKGDKRSIYEAIDQFKQTDFSNYLNFCQKISLVSDIDFCADGDPRVRSGVNLYNNGCFVRGARAIYLTPEHVYSQALVSKRAQTLESLSGKLD